MKSLSTLMNMLNFRTMKTMFICLLAATGLLACRSTKERMWETYRQDAISDVVSYIYSRQQQRTLDSTRQLWSFYSDSAFTFHPDSGLQALSGYLLLD